MQWKFLASLEGSSRQLRAASFPPLVLKFLGEASKVGE